MANIIQVFSPYDSVKIRATIGWEGLTLWQVDRYICHPKNLSRLADDDLLKVKYFPKFKYCSHFKHYVLAISSMLCGTQSDPFGISNASEHQYYTMLKQNVGHDSI